MPTFTTYSYWDGEPIQRAKIKELNGNLPDYWVDFQYQPVGKPKISLPENFLDAHDFLETINDDSILLMVNELDDASHNVHEKLISNGLKFCMTSLYVDEMDSRLYYSKSYIFGIFNFDSKEDAMLAKLIIDNARSLEVEEYRGLFRET